MDAGGGQHLTVVQGEKGSISGDAVGERGEMGDIGKLGRQQGRGDVGIGIAVEYAGTDFFVKIRYYQILPGIQGFAAPQGPVVPPEFPDADAVSGGDGSHRFAGMHRVDLTGGTDNQRLPYGQRAAGRYLVVRRQTGGIDAVIGGDSIDGFPGLHYINGHKCITSYGETMRRAGGLGHGFSRGCLERF